MAIKPLDFYNELSAHDKLWDSSWYCFFTHFITLTGNKWKPYKTSAEENL